MGVKVRDHGKGGVRMDANDFIKHVGDALREAGHPTAAPVPGPDGDEGVSHVECVRALAEERDALQRRVSELEEQIDTQQALGDLKADRDRWHETTKTRNALIVRLCAAAGISTDADEDDLVRAFGAVKTNEERLRGEVAAMREASQRLVTASGEINLWGDPTGTPCDKHLEFHRAVRHVRTVLATNAGAPEVEAMKKGSEADRG